MARKSQENSPISTLPADPVWWPHRLSKALTNYRWAVPARCFLPVTRLMCSSTVSSDASQYRTATVADFTISHQEYRQQWPECNNGLSPYSLLTYTSTCNSQYVVERRTKKLWYVISIRCDLGKPKRLIRGNDAMVENRQLSEIGAKSLYRRQSERLL